MSFSWKKKQSRVKNIFHTKKATLLSMEETRRAAQKQNKCGHPLKQFQSVCEDLSGICKGRGGGHWRRCCRDFGDGQRRPALLRLSLSTPSCESWTVPLWAAAVEQQGSLGAWVWPWLCPSALVSNVVIHWGWDVGHYWGASSCCKVTCYSWTYGWQEHRHDSDQALLRRIAGVLVGSNKDELNKDPSTTVRVEDWSLHGPRCSFQLPRAFLLVHETGLW